jgi:hypothetical protein
LDFFLLILGEGAAGALHWTAVTASRSGLFPTLPSALRPYPRSHCLPHFRHVRAVVTRPSEPSSEVNIFCPFNLPPGDALRFSNAPHLPALVRPDPGECSATTRQSGVLG